MATTPRSLRYKYRRIYTVKSLLASTPRSKASRLRKKLSPKVKYLARRALDLSSLDNPESVEDGNSTGWYQAVINSVRHDQSVKHRSLVGAGGIRWLELSRTNCRMDELLGPVDEVRITISFATQVYQLYVQYPIPRPVQQFKGTIMYSISTCRCVCMLVRIN